jgi:spore coat polysaccharide biosynthesis protein SpsF (cytidylyltransferase family)
VTPKERVVAIIQARMSSHRLPRKVALDIHGQSLLERVVGQVRRARTVDEVVVATSTSDDDEIVALICRRLGAPCFRGSLADVRARYVAAAREHGAAIVVRVTADNPLTEPVFIDSLVEALRREPTLRYCIMDKARVPDGSQAEAFRLAALVETLAGDDSDYSREHVTPALRREAAARSIPPPAELELSDYFVGIDTFEHYLHINRLFSRYGGGEDLLRRLIADVKRERAAQGLEPAARRS